MSKVAYLGEVTGDNTLMAPEQLLELVRRHIDEDEVFSKRRGPVTLKGLHIIVVGEEQNDEGTLRLEEYRCGLPKFVEIAVVTRVWQRLVGAVSD